MKNKIFYWFLLTTLSLSLILPLALLFSNKKYKGSDKTIISIVRTARLDTFTDAEYKNSSYLYFLDIETGEYFKVRIENFCDFQDKIGDVMKITEILTYEKDKLIKTEYNGFQLYLCY